MNQALNRSFRYALPSIFRAPPAEGEPPYTPYVHPSSASSIEKYTIPQLEAILDELMVLGRALGYPDSPDALPASLGKTILENTAAIHRKADSTHKPSMMLDMERGQPMEVEVILGEVVRMAKEVGVEVPVSSFLFSFCETICKFWADIAFQRVEMMYALLLVVQNQILRVRQERQ